MGCQKIKYSRLVVLIICWLMWEEDEAASLEYFLNSVEELDFDGERMRLSGVCSPVVRGITEA